MRKTLPCHFHTLSIPLPLQTDGSAPQESYSWWAHTTGNQISSRLLSARSANALLELPRASGTLAAGTWVSALLFDDLQHMALTEGAAPVPATAGFIA